MKEKKKQSSEGYLKLMPMLDPKIFMVNGETRFRYVTIFTSHTHTLSLSLSQTYTNTLSLAHPHSLSRAHARTQYTYTLTHTAKDTYRSPK